MSDISNKIAHLKVDYKIRQQQIIRLVNPTKYDIKYSIELDQGKILNIQINPSEGDIKPRDFVNVIVDTSKIIFDQSYLISKLNLKYWIIKYKSKKYSAQNRLPIYLIRRSDNDTKWYSSFNIVSIMSIARIIFSSIIIIYNIILIINYST